MSVDVLVNTEDITVLGSPPIVEVKLDIGATGQRGSRVFVGTGNPNIFTSSTGNNYTIFSQPLYINDLYINNSAGQEYSYMYQFISSLGTNSWVPILKINPTLYSKTFTAEFIDGESNITFLVSDIVESSGTPLTAENFSIQYSISYSKPTSSSISGVSIANIGGADNLSIDFIAHELDTGVWQAINQPAVTISLLITIVFPEEVS